MVTDRDARWRPQGEPPSDAALWASAVAGDPSSFGEIFQRHGSSVHAYCARRLGDPHAAEDVVSLVFLESWRRRSDVVIDSDTVLPWLYGVAAMCLRNRARTAARHRAALDRIPHHRGDDLAGDVADRVDLTAQMALVQAALNEMSPQDQDVLVLCLWQELDYQSAAIALGVPTGTVKSRLSRARVRLAAKIRAAGGVAPSEGVTY